MDLEAEFREAIANANKYALEAARNVNVQGAYCERNNLTAENFARIAQALATRIAG